MKDPLELLEDLRVKLEALGNAYNAAIVAYNAYSTNLRELFMKIAADEKQAIENPEALDEHPIC